MKRLGRGTITLVILQIMILTSVFVMGSSIIGNNRLKINNRCFLSDHAGAIYVETGDDVSLFWKCVHKNMKNSGNLRKKNLSGSVNLIGIYSKEVSNHPEIVDGRYFLLDEMGSGELKVVVGKNLRDKIYQKNPHEEKEYIKIDEMECQVIGIMGDKEASAIDDIIMIPLYSWMNYGQKQGYPDIMIGEYIIDDASQKTVEETCDMLKKDFNKNGIFSFTDEKTDEEKSVLEVLSEKKEINLVYFGMLLSIFLVLLSALVFWLGNKENEIEIERIHGNDFMGCFFLMMKKYSQIFIFSVLVSMVFFSILVQLGVVYRVSYVSIVWMIVGTLFPTVLLIFFKLFYYYTYGWNCNGESIKSYGIIVIQLCIFLCLLCDIGTYYLNITTESWIKNSKQGYQFYSLMPNLEADTGASVVPDKSSGFENFENAISELEHQELFQFHSVNISDTLNIPVSILDNYFKKADWKEYTYDAVNAFSTKSYSTPEEVKGIPVVMMPLCRANQGAVEFYFSDIEEGEKLSSKDFEIDFTNGIPTLNILLGYDYKDFFKVGDTFELCYGTTIRLRVAGILKKETIYYSDQTSEEEELLVSMNKRIIMPYYHILNKKVSEDQYYFGIYNYSNYPYGTMVLGKNDSKQMCLKAEKIINRIFLENNLVPAYTLGESPGIFTFQSVTEKLIKVITVLYLVAVVFCLISLCLCVINQWKQRSYIHGIEIINGRSMGNIFGEYGVKIFFVCFLALICATYLKRVIVGSNVLFEVLMMIASTAVFLVCIAVIGIFIRTMDVEEDVRKNFI